MVQIPQNLGQIPLIGKLMAKPNLYRRHEYREKYQSLRRSYMFPSEPYTMALCDPEQD